MASGSNRQGASSARRTREWHSDKDINILLLGQTGVGKSTFINTLANYLLYDTLEKATNEELQTPIPSSFSHTDPETFEEKTIEVGKKDNQEKVNENGQSDSTQCKSYVFPLGDRVLRLIDTPGMGDTRGVEQDKKNFFEILTYISHYEHLKGICIFLKPNDERLTIVFRLCIREILRYLHEQARENIIFIFTNARSTFFMPGSSQKILHGLLQEHQRKFNINVPFSRENTFLLDNEVFRYLALREHGVKIDPQQMESYEKSWEYSAKEYQRFLIYVQKRPLLAVDNGISLHGAEQLIRRLTRPIAEILRLIQANIQLATDSKRELAQHQGKASEGFAQYILTIQPFSIPRLVCISQKCSKVSRSNNEEERIVHHVCQEKSYLDGVIQEAISDPRIAQLKIINKQTGKYDQLTSLNLTKII